MAQQRKRAKAVASHESFLRHAHFRWLKVAAAVSLVVIAGFAATLVLTDFRLRHTGSSWFGYTSGTLGAGLIVWLAMLGIRKRAMTDDAWSLKAWVSAHVYLGLSLIVIGTLHSGLQFGWNIHTLAYALMMLVILSGLFGVFAYAKIPPILSDNRGETTQKQMLEKIHALDGRLLEVARPLNQEQAALVVRAVRHTRIGGNVWQRLNSRRSNCTTANAQRVLLATRKRMSDGPQAIALDQVLTLLEEKCVTLAKARRHIRLRSLLEVWLFIHIPTTLALIAALTAHIVSVFFFW
ncbi:MAG: hypothetical protein H0U98_13480 [Alphaproteobacteria bacterium]|nr:hypothetical protein [Alphaproteobacteria bacterium]